MATILENAFRHDVLTLLDKPTGNIGVELGVAKGIFSERMVGSRRFEIFYGIDRYGDHHDVEEYKSALRRVGLRSPYRLLRMSFDEAYDLFEDESLDFVYIDGYAHSGEEGGDTIYKWARKVRLGGVIAGDDYHARWPLVVRAVDRFARDTGFELFVTGRVEPTVDYCGFPSWAMLKTHATPFDTPAEVRALWNRSAQRKHAAKQAMRNVVTAAKTALKRLLGEEMVGRVRRYRRRARS
jgi:hypothetical protein